MISVSKAVPGLPLPETKFLALKHSCNDFHHITREDSILETRRLESSVKSALTRGPKHGANLMNESSKLIDSTDSRHLVFSYGSAGYCSCHKISLTLRAEISISMACQQHENISSILRTPVLLLSSQNRHQITGASFQGPTGFSRHPWPNCPSRAPLARSAPGRAFSIFRAGPVGIQARKRRRGIGGALRAPACHCPSRGPREREAAASRRQLQAAAGAPPPREGQARESEGRLRRWALKKLVPATGHGAPSRGRAFTVGLGLRTYVSYLCVQYRYQLCCTTSVKLIVFSPGPGTN